MMRDLPLALVGGFHVGPLFEPQIKRGSKRGTSTVLPGRMRRAAERQATPAWADKQAIAAAYKAARDATAATGITHSLDHIVPLQHPLVCGLHVHWNMRVIPLDDNLRKSNAWWPDMPGEQMPLL